MQFDHVFLYMAFGSLVAIGGFVLALLAKSGDGHGSVNVLGFSISLQAAGGILVIAIGALIFLTPMMMGRDLNQRVEIQRLEREKADVSKRLLAARSALSGKVSLDDLQFASVFVDYPVVEPAAECARKLAEQYPVARKDYVKDGWLVANYERGLVYYRCGTSVAIFVVSDSASDASALVEAAADEAKALYPHGSNESAPTENQITPE